MSEHASSAEGRTDINLAEMPKLYRNNPQVMALYRAWEAEAARVVTMGDTLHAAHERIRDLESRPTPSAASEAEVEDVISRFEAAITGIGNAWAFGPAHRDVKHTELDALRADLRAKLLSGQQAEARAEQAEARLAKLAAAMELYTAPPESIVGRGRLVIGINHWADSDVFDVGIAGSHVEDHKTILGALTAALDALPEPTR